MLAHFRYALRLYLKNSGFCLLAITCLGLGIGVNTSMFSLLDFALFKPLPVPNPWRLILFSRGDSGLFSFPEYQDLRQRCRTVELAMFNPTESSLEYERNNHLISAEAVSANYSRVAKIGTVLGKWFKTETEPEAVLSYSAWRRWFHSDPSVIGKRIRAETRWYTVTGVAAKDFAGTYVPLQTDLWIPFRAWIHQYPNLEAQLENRNKPRLMIFGRLLGTSSIAQSAAELNSISKSEVAHAPQINLRQVEGFTDQTTRRGSVRLIGLLMAVVGLVLLIACLNVGNLLLAHSASRQSEIAVRLALGARRMTVLVQLLTENILLAGGGAVAAIMIRYWADRLLNAAIPDLGPLVSFSLNLSFDFRILLFTLVVSLATIFVFGLAPAWRMSKTDISAALGSVNIARASIRIRQGTQMVQVCVSLVLLMAAGVFLRSFLALRNADPGFAIRNRIFATTYISTPEFNRDTGRTFYAGLISRVKGLPYVENAGLTYLLPLTGGSQTCVSSATGRTIPAEDGAIDSNFLPTLNIPIISGRNFTALDRADGLRVAIINENLAYRLSRRESIIGRHIQIGCDNPAMVEVVGVVKNFAMRSIRERRENVVYYPFAQRYTGLANIVIETRGFAGLSGSQVINAIRKVLLDSSPGLRIFEIGSLSQRVEQSFWQTKWEASIIGLFAVLALTLAAIGLYGVTAYNVTTRTREIGTRMAIGARAVDVFRLILGDGLRLTLVGVVLGLAFSLAVAKLFSAFLYGVSSTDPFTSIACITTWIVIALTACLLPARRAANVQPIEALRHE